METATNLERIHALSSKILSEEKEIDDIGKHIFSVIKDRVKFLTTQAGLESSINSSIRQYQEKQTSILSGERKLGGLRGDALANAKTTLDIERLNLKSLEAKIMLQRTLLDIYSLSLMTVKKSFEIFKSIDESQSDMRKELGLFRGGFQELDDTVDSVARKNALLGVTFDDSKKSVIEISNRFSEMDALTPNLVDRMTKMDKILGIAANKSIEFYDTVAQVAGVSLKEAAENTFEMAKNMSAGTKIPLGKIMNSVAGASEKVRTMTGGSVLNLIKAAAYAQKMGTSLDRMADSARFMLDFEESVSAEMEASVMIGKNISFGKARELAFAGKIVEANEEILNQVRSIGNFDKMNALQKESVAKAAGKSVTELQSMLQRQKQILDIEMHGSDTEKEMLKRYKEALSITEETAKAKAKLTMEEMKSVVNQSRMTQLAGQWTDLMLKVTKPIVEDITRAMIFLSTKLEEFNGYISSVSPGTKEIAKNTIRWVAYIGLALPLLKGIAKLFSVIRPTNLFGGWFSGKKSVKDIADAAKGIATTPVAVKSIGDKMKEGAASFKTGFEAIISVIKTLAEGFKTGFKLIIDIVKTVGIELILLVKNLGKTLLFALSELANGTIRLFGGIIAELGTIAKSGNIQKIMSALGNSIAAFFVPLRALIAPQVMGGIAIFTLAMLGLGFAFKMAGEGLGAAAPGIQALGGVVKEVFLGVGSVLKTIGGVIIETIQSLTASVKSLADIGGWKLLGVANGIGAIALAFAGFGAGSAWAGVGSFIGNIFGGDMFSKLQKFADLSDKFSTMSESLKMMKLTSDQLTESILNLVKSLTKLSEISPIAQAALSTGIRTTEKTKDRETTMVSLSDVVNAINGLRDDFRNGKIVSVVDLDKVSEKLLSRNPTRATS